MPDLIPPARPALSDPACPDPVPGLAALLATDSIFAACHAVGRRFDWELRPGGFGGLVHIILEQQVSLASGRAVYRKLAERLGTVTAAGFLALDDETLRGCGFSRQKTGYCRALAVAVAEERLDLTAIAGLPDAEAMAALVALKGIGRWTAEIYLLLSLGRPDIWPAGDLALQVGLQWLKDLPARPTAAELDALAEPWRPHRSLAARLVWSYYLARTAARRGT